MTRWLLWLLVIARINTVVKPFGEISESTGYWHKMDLPKVLEIGQIKFGLDNFRKKYLKYYTIWHLDDGIDIRRQWKERAKKLNVNLIKW